MEQKIYAAIDLKSFYASCECVARKLDPLTTNLLVADASRTDKTICLAVSPSLKALGVSSRPRLFEAIEQIGLANARRRMALPGGSFTGSSSDARALEADPSLSIDYITAPPRMALYMAQSAKVYGVYLKHVAPEDIHVYSVDEVFIDLTPYLRLRGLTAYEFTRRIILDVLATTGITATAGIGSNLYLCKVAMDIVAKKIPADEHGVRIAQLDEQSYRRQLWEHQPLTDFWRIGPGYTRRLAKVGITTMGQIARCSLGKPGEFYSEDLLYRLFGVQAQLLIDHAWGWEPCTIADIKAYRPATNSLSTGQVLTEPYSWEKARLIVREMADLLALDLVDKGLQTRQLVLHIGYDRENLTDPYRAASYRGAVDRDHYGRAVPRHAHGTANLTFRTSSTEQILEAVTGLFEQITDPGLWVRRITITACAVTAEAPEGEALWQQLDLFSDPVQEQQRLQRLERERRRQKAVLEIRSRFGKNAILKGMNFQEGATTRLRNSQIGGHRA